MGGIERIYLGTGSFWQNWGEGLGHQSLEFNPGILPVKRGGGLSFQELTIITLSKSRGVKSKGQGEKSRHSTPPAARKGGRAPLLEPQPPFAGEPGWVLKVEKLRMKRQILLGGELFTTRQKVKCMERECSMSGKRRTALILPWGGKKSTELRGIRSTCRAVKKMPFIQKTT